MFQAKIDALESAIERLKDKRMNLDSEDFYGELGQELKKRIRDLEEDLDQAYVDKDKFRG